MQSFHFQSKFFWIVHNIVCAVYLVFLPIGKAKCRVAGFSVFLVLVDRNRKCVGNLNIITETDTVKRVVPAFFKYLFRTFLLIGHDQSVEYDRHPQLIMVIRARARRRRYVHLSSPLQVKQDSCQEQTYSDYYNYCPFSYQFNFLRTPVLQYKCRAKQLIFQYSYIYNLIKRRGKQK